MKEFINENKLVIKILVISSLIYVLIVKILSNIPIINGLIYSINRIEVKIATETYTGIIPLILWIPITISLIILIIKAIIKLIKW